jgi:hypothetical protein
MFLAWLFFPLLILALFTGAGLLLEALGGRRLPGVLLPALGLAALIVSVQLVTAIPGGGPFAGPLAVVLAIAGFARADRTRLVRPELGALAAALVVFLAYAAPVLASGQSGFAGYVKLDDTATWLAVTDRLAEHGAGAGGLAPSSYEATLAAYPEAGYPTGAFGPLAIGTQLAGSDPAWLFAPLLALGAALLSLCFWELARPLLPSRALRAVVCALAPQAAVLYGYVMWGGVKELIAALLIALFASLVSLLLARPPGRRELLPAAFAVAALAAVLSPGGLLWLAPILAPALAILVRRLSLRAALGQLSLLAAIAAALSAPLVARGRLLPPVEHALSDPAALINLFRPLPAEQLLGVWPALDFRIATSAPGLTAALCLALGAGAAIGLALAWRSRAWGVLLQGAAAVGGFALIALTGSPWIAAKAMACASAAILLLCLAGAATLAGRSRSPAGAVLLIFIGSGVLLSSALAYQGVNLAPRQRLAELERIGRLFAGQGPALLTEYEPYGARHFLRRLEAEGSSELRRRQVPLLDGRIAEKGEWSDTDRIDPEALFAYRTLVLRRSPAQSRPPAAYRLRWRGRYYEVWQRPKGARAPLRLALGSAPGASARPDCAAIERLARQAGPGGQLLAAPGAPARVIDLGATAHPAAWERAPGLLPLGAGQAAGRFEIAAGGRFEAWLGGSVKAEMILEIDGRVIGRARSELNPAGLYVSLGAVRLGRGRHSFVLRYGGADLHPGSAASAETGFAVGPLVLAQSGRRPLLRIPASRADLLCRGDLDWVEITR